MVKGKAITKIFKHSGKYALKHGTKLDSVTKFVKKNPGLKALLPKITLKRVILGTGVAVGTAYGIDAIQTYMTENSGCFLYEGDTLLCKVPQLSCCNYYLTENITECNQFAFLNDPCDNYDEKTEKSCCRKCDCSFHNCLPNQRMECKKTTVQQAISVLSKNASKSIIEAITSIEFVRYFFMGFAVLIFAILIYKFC